MAVTVELGLSKAFTLDDPVAGVIGSTEFTIGGVSFEDVTSRVRSISLSRGKNRDLDRFNSGSLSVEFNNTDRAFDPLYTSSPFAGNIVPRRDMRVLAEVEEPVATGGTISDIDVNGIPYRVHTFTAVGTAIFTIDRTVTVDYLIVGGGGGGGAARSGSDASGGGGAGGVSFGSKVVSAGSKTVVVGNGGTGSTSNVVVGASNQGGSSSFDGISVLGGGQGGSALDGGSGASGGGGGQAGSGGLGTTNQGFAGGVGANTGGLTRAGGGGGGAGEVGGNASASIGGKGGDGFFSRIRNPNGEYFAGGGGGGARGGVAGVGGLGGGANGVIGVNGLNASANTGGGGGGTGGDGTGDVIGGDGGSGVVVIRYPLKEVQYVGKVLDWNFTYDPSGQSIAELQASDAFTFLAQQVLTPGTATEQTSGARVNAVLSQASVDWPVGDRVIDTGASTLGADVFDGNALQYLQKVELSEGGLFFIDKQGRVAFKDRLSTPTTDNVTVFSDVAGSGIPFAPAQVEYGSEQLYNQVTVTSAFGTATANGALSQTRYGILERDVQTLLSSQTQVEDYADFLVGRYDEPEYRFARIAVDMDNLSSAQKAQMFALDMGSVIQVNFTPNSVGDSISRYGLVISLGHSVSPDEHIMTVGVGSLQTSLFVIGDSEFGTIGVDAPGVLGF